MESDSGDKFVEWLNQYYACGDPDSMLMIYPTKEKGIMATTRDGSKQWIARNLTELMQVVDAYYQFETD